MVELARRKQAWFNHDIKADGADMFLNFLKRLSIHTLILIFFSFLLLRSFNGFV